MQPEPERQGLWALLRRGLLKLLPPATPQPEEREPVWSVSRRDATTFFRLLGLLWLAGLAYVVRRTPYPAPPPSETWAPATTRWDVAADFIAAALGEFGPIAIGIVIIAMLLTRPLNVAGVLLMSLYQFMVNRYINPVIERHVARGRAEGLVEGRAEGRIEGLTEGRIEGQTERDVEWLEWLQRHPEIMADLDEPPPAGWPDDDREIC